jgi:hypothetical protein
MHSLTELDQDKLNLARQCAGTLIVFKAYLPAGGTLLMLIGKFRDDVLDVMAAERDPSPQRGTERYPLDKLTPIALDTVSGAASILLDSFTPYMDDPLLPRLLRRYHADLNTLKAERTKTRTQTDATAS